MILILNYKVFLRTLPFIQVCVGDDNARSPLPFGSRLEAPEGKTPPSVARMIDGRIGRQRCLQGFLKDIASFPEPGNCSFFLCFVLFVR